MIGGGYGVQRRPDPRIAAAIAEAVGDAASVLNVGAGAGSYEPADRRLVAVEPSRAMLRQRPAGAAPAVQAVARALPFRDGAFGATLAILTLHHWSDRPRGLAELARVAARRVVVLTWDSASRGFWLVDEYFPELAAIDRAIFPRLAELEGAWGALDVRVVPVPHDCRDGFLGAYWRRPAAYLDPAVRAGMSTFTKLAAVEPGLARLRRDLADGTWTRRHGHLLDRTELDLGYRLVVAGV